MTDLPPHTPPAIVVPAPAVAPLVIPVLGAQYDSQKHLATVSLGNAFRNASRILEYKGEYVTLTYHGHNGDLTPCPVVKVPSTNMSRDFSQILSGVISVNIKDIPQETHDKVDAAKCLKIDTPTAQLIARF